MTNSIVFKRFLAYFIDLFIISILIVLLSQVKFLNPNRNKYKKAVGEYTEYNKELQEKIKKMETVDSEALLTDEYVKYVKNIDYYGVSYTIIEIVVFILYFTILPLFNNGQTFGKEFMKIRIINNNDSNVGFGKLLLYSLFMPICTNIFLYTLVKNVLLAVLVFFLKPWSYFYVNGSISMILAIYCYIDVITLFINKNHLSIHDKLLKTKVIDYVRVK